MKVLITDYDFHDIQLEHGVLEGGGLEVLSAQCKTEEQVIEAGQGCSALLVQYAPITDRVLAALSQVGIVSRFGAGFDTVDTAAAKKHGVWVSNSPDYGVGEVATHALAMALCLLRHLPFYDRDVKSGTWHYESPGKLQRVSNLTLGILGLGRIGKRMAHIARNSFKRVIACDPYIIDGDFPAYVERVGLEDLFRNSDCISLHLPLNTETRGMVNASLLGLMRPESVLVNTARGAIVNVDDLAQALNEGRLDGAGLDVLPWEPLPTDHPIAKQPRVVLSPHAAFYSVEAERELRRKAAQNIVTWAKRGRPDYVVVEGRGR
jgi:phosphoglycerate dehydrogenase-like enzyme